MSTIKPTGYPSWAHSATNIAEPTDAKKAVGWAVSEKPASSYMNWLQEKSAAWIRYLSYDVIVDDDFNRSFDLSSTFGAGLPGVTPSGQIPTGFFPHYKANYPVYFADTENNYAGLPSLGIGKVGCYMNFSGFANFEHQVAGLNSRDFVMEFIAKKAAGGGSGGYFQMGIMHSHTGTATGVGCWWSVTGLSSIWHLNWGYSNNATSINSGVYSNQKGYLAVTYPTAYQALVVERIGQTLVAQIDGTEVAVIGNLGATLVNNYAQMGFRVMNTTGTSDILIDKMKLGVRR